MMVIMVGRIGRIEESVNMRRQIIFTIYEGEKTEPEYFKQFFDCKGNKIKCELMAIPKKNVDQDNTDRDEMVTIAESYLDYITGNLTAFELVKIVLDDFSISIQRKMNYDNDRDVRKFHNTIREKRKEIIRNSEKFTDSKGNVIDGMKDEFVNFIHEKYLDKLIEIAEDKLKINLKNFKYKFSNPDVLNPDVKYSKQDDRVFVVFDRDVSPKRTDKLYNEIVDRCESKNFEILLSNPKFEMWLFMHHKDADYSLIYKDNSRLSEDVDDELIRLEGRTNKPKEVDGKRFDKYYKNNFNIALEASSKNKLTIDVRKLISNPGSNVGVKLNSLFES